MRTYGTGLCAARNGLIYDAIIERNLALVYCWCRDLRVVSSAPHVLTALRFSFIGLSVCPPGSANSVTIMRHLIFFWVYLLCRRWFGV